MSSHQAGHKIENSRGITHQVIPTVVGDDSCRQMYPFELTMVFIFRMDDYFRAVGVIPDHKNSDLYSALVATPTDFPDKR